MKAFNKKSIFLIVALWSMMAANGFAQKAKDCIKASTISRPTYVLVSSEKLGDFYRNFKEEASFGNTKIVKSELAYYLLATEKNGNRIFAFELEQKGKKLYLNKKLPVQICSQGDLSLDTFLQEDGKIKGCKMGAHKIMQLD